VRGVFDHTEVVLARDLVDLVDATRHAGVVHGHDRPRPRADEATHGGRIDAHRFLLDVAEDNVGSGRSDRLVTGNVGKRWTNDFVPLSQPDKLTRGVQGRRTRRQRQEVPVVLRECEIPRELVFELVREPSDSEPAAIERTRCGIVDLGAQIRLENGNLGDLRRGAHSLIMVGGGKDASKRVREVAGGAAVLKINWAGPASGLPDHTHTAGPAQEEVLTWSRPFAKARTGA
jgi:hypothetical protein